MYSPQVRAVSKKKLWFSGRFIFDKKHNTTTLNTSRTPPNENSFQSWCSVTIHKKPKLDCFVFMNDLSGLMHFQPIPPLINHIITKNSSIVELLQQEDCILTKNQVQCNIWT